MLQCGYVPVAAQDLTLRPDQAPDDPISVNDSYISTFVTLQIKGKTTEELRQEFNIVSDWTPAELEAIGR